MGSLNDFARKVGRDLSDSNIEIDNWLIDTIDNHLDGMFDSPRKGVFYPSSIANPCDRMLWLSFNTHNTKQLFVILTYLNSIMLHWYKSYLKF